MIQTSVVNLTLKLSLETTRSTNHSVDIRPVRLNSRILERSALQLAIYVHKKIRVVDVKGPLIGVKEAIDLENAASVINACEVDRSRNDLGEFEKVPGLR